MQGRRRRRRRRRILKTGVFFSGDADSCVHIDDNNVGGQTGNIFNQPSMTCPVFFLMVTGFRDSVTPVTGLFSESVHGWRR